jgi:hypothetical protein
MDKEGQQTTGGSSSIKEGATPKTSTLWRNPDRGDSNGGTRGLRTSKVYLTKGVSGYSRESFKDYINETVGIHQLEACGPTSAPHIWLLTFKSVETKETFESRGDFTCNGQPARIHRVMPKAPKPKRNYVRVHWIPYHIPMEAAMAELDTIEGMRIVSAGYETCQSEGMSHVRTLVRMLCIETDRKELIPSYFKWTYRGQTGRAMVTLKGRPPQCLRCEKYGHVRRECKEPKCVVCNQFGHNDPTCNLLQTYAATLKVNAVTSQPTEDDVDLLEEDAVETEVADQTTSKSVSDSLATTDAPAQAVAESTDATASATQFETAGQQQTSVTPTPPSDQDDKVISTGAELVALTVNTPATSSVVSGDTKCDTVPLDQLVAVARASMEPSSVATLPPLNSFRPFSKGKMATIDLVDGVPLAPPSVASQDALDDSTSESIGDSIATSSEDDSIVLDSTTDLDSTVTSDLGETMDRSSTPVPSLSVGKRPHPEDHNSPSGDRSPVVRNRQKRRAHRKSNQH